MQFLTIAACSLFSQLSSDYLFSPIMSISSLNKGKVVLKLGLVCAHQSLCTSASERILTVVKSSRNFPRQSGNLLLLEGNLGNVRLREWYSTRLSRLVRGSLHLPTLQSLRNSKECKTRVTEVGIYNQRIRKPSERKRTLRQFHTSS